MNINALLIGINFYLPNKLPNGLYYKSLAGCVQDVTRVEKFLCNSLGVQEQRLIKLTSSHGDGQVPLEPQSQWPTYANIVAAFGKLESMAEPGDQIYIHYSGHGGRSLTTPEFREIKGMDGIDEVLVPMDLGDSEGRYLRDTDLHYLLMRLVDKKCFVTLVLDSCHAGGASRSRLLDVGENDAVVRGIGAIDDTARPSHSLVASPQQLLETWITCRQPDAARSVTSGSGWLLEPKGYVLLAACRANEYANEYPFEGEEKNGALSYWLLDTLKQITPRFTYKMLHDRVLAKVHGQFPDQTPQLQGEGNRIVFGCEELPVQSAVTVIGREGADRVILNAGQAHGIEQGAKFSVFALYETDFRNKEAQIATVEVAEVGATSSTARVLNSADGSEIEPGCQAVLSDVGRRQLRRRVRLARLDEYQEAFKEVEEVVASTSSGFLQLVTNGERADYLITVHNGQFVICDPGGFEIENLKPEIYIAEPGAAIELVKRLVHLAKYFHVRTLHNDGFQSFGEGVECELIGSHDESSAEMLTIRDGETAVLRVRNNSEAVLNITVLDLQPDWGISQVYPSRAGAFESLDPGKEIKLPLRMRLPHRYTRGTDVLKVFATKGTTSFRWFELPPLEPLEKRRSNALQDLLSAIGSEESITRQVEVLANPALEWTVQQLELDIRAVETTAKQFAVV